MLKPHPALLSNRQSLTLEQLAGYLGRIAQRFANKLKVPMER
jgi:hypothetical protein